MMALMRAPSKLVLKCSTLAMLAGAALSCAGAADSYKCKNSAGQITYSNQPCEKLGLQPAGPIRDRVMVVPAYKPPAAPSRPAAKSDEKDEAKPGAALKPVNPLTEKVTKP